MTMDCTFPDEPNFAVTTLTDTGYTIEVMTEADAVSQYAYLVYITDNQFKHRDEEGFYMDFHSDVRYAHSALDVGIYIHTYN